MRNLGLVLSIVSEIDAKQYVSIWHCDTCLPGCCCHNLQWTAWQFRFSIIHRLVPASA